MSRNNLFIGIAAVLCLTGLTAGASFAQAPQRGGRGGGAPDNTVMAPRELKPGLFLLTGAGANTLVRVTTEGLIVVDTKNPGDEQANSLLAQIKTLSPLPVKFVINTQHHPDHVGNNQKLLDAGAQVLGLEALKTFMGSDPRTTQIPGRPTQTFARDYVLKLGGAEVQAHFYGRGHTGDDTMVYFPDAKVVMVSDQMTDANPVIDWANGGSWVEWPKSLEGVLKLDFEIAIQGRGEPKTRADVQAFKDKVDLVIKRAGDAIKAGATKETLAMQVKVDDLAPWNLNAQFFGNLYDELKK
ncbi:MAG TPA: MBL fold metallo-hydrolase [Terriglobia bacterium]|nr:MBL fold metallo-hydrolase [Terriglobia bacterium]